MVEEGDKVKKNQELFVIEAMKMGTTITANISGTVKKIHLSEGTMVKSDDLVVEME
jgi:pyruvate carboxylase